MANFTFNPSDLEPLKRLLFLPRFASVDVASGVRRSRRTGDGSEFLDYRSYISGDDPRSVDWNVYARDRQLIVRLKESPRQVSVTILVDASRSMAFCSPCTKLQQAQQIACALGFIAMRGGDRVYVHAIGDNSGAGIGPVSGARGLASIVHYLSSLSPGGQSDLRAATRRLRAQRRDRGIVVVISDLLNIPQREEALRGCVGAGGTLLVVQVLDPIDRGQGLTGRLRLRDSETGQMVDVELDSERLRQYAAAVDADSRRLATFCRGPRRHFLRVSTNENYLQAVCDALRSKAILR